MNNTITPIQIDVLCVGATSFDLTFSVDEHPESDDKSIANSFFSCGGGPAANAAVCVSRLGRTSALIGYIGNDSFGDIHLNELKNERVNTDFIVRGSNPTPISTILVKPNGHRALVNFKDETNGIKESEIDLSAIKPKVILFDGHEPHISPKIIDWAKENNIPTILDAGSLHKGTEYLMDKVDYLVASEKFALQVTKETNPNKMLELIAKVNPQVVITFGEKGLIWKMDEATGSYDSFKINAIDTTGAGDAFHGAFAYALALEFSWNRILEFSSAVAALCCTKIGARTGMPYLNEVEDFLSNNRE